MMAATNAAGFCFLKVFMTALFSPAQIEPRKTAATTAIPMNIPTGFRNLQVDNIWTGQNINVTSARLAQRYCGEWRPLVAQYD